MSKRSYVLSHDQLRSVADAMKERAARRGPHQKADQRLWQFLDEAVTTEDATVEFLLEWDDGEEDEAEDE